MTVLAETQPVQVQVAAPRTTRRRRLLGVLVTAQVLAGLGQSGAAAGALLARDMTGRDDLASLPVALLVVGAAGLVLPIAALSRRGGRRVGLTAALAAGGFGAVLTVVAAATGNFPLLLVASAIYGAGQAAVMLARYAAADLSPASHRGRAMGLVVVATTVGAVAGPNLLPPAGRFAAALGLPPLTGLYLLSAVALFAAAAILFAYLRPDPLDLATDPAEELSVAAPVGWSPTARAGLAWMVLGNVIMVGVMAMAPVHLHQHGHGLAFVGFVISLHVLGMFAPAPLTGWLTDRVRPTAVATGGTQLLILAGAILAVGDSGLAMAAGLFLLGVGWNATLVAGSAMLAAGVPAAERPRAEGMGEMGMGAAAIAGSVVAGPVVGLTSYPTLAAAAALIAAVAVPLGYFSSANRRRR